MMYKLVVTELAHQDLDAILLYISDQLSNPRAALDFLDEVEHCYGNLRDNPAMYEKCRDKRLEDEGFRRVVLGSYVLVYKTDDESHTVTVMRFFYGARDYSNLI